MNEPTLDYYKDIFRNNPQRLSSIKILLMKDFKAMEEQFSLAAEQNDFKAMRAELHKIQPIVFNLRFSRMLDLIETYKQNENEAVEISKLNQQLKECLSDLYHFLERE
jgi:hypothetical protein